MRSALLLAAGVLAATTTACSSGMRVRTSLAPGASLSGLRTFHVLAAPTRRADAPSLPANDPMLDNSMTNRALRDDLNQALQARGYASAPRTTADFLVAYYAGTKEKFDTTFWGPAVDPAWRYRYWGRAGWAWPWYAGPVPVEAQITEHTEGQVIVDVIDAHTQQLLWRGQEVAPVSDDPSKYTGALHRAATAVINKFPRGPGAVAAGGA